VKTLAARVESLRRSEIRVLFDAADDQPDAIRLEVGEPSFTTPAHIIDAAAAAAREGHTGYGPNGGLESLRHLLSDKILRVNGFSAEPTNIVVTPGAMNALFSIYMALLEPGDEVLLPTPGFPNMDEMVRLLGGRPVFYELDPKSDFIPDVDEIDRLCGAKTKAVFVNTPSNPTGAVFPPAVVRSIVDVTREHGVWLVSDEVYDEMILDPAATHASAASFPGSDHVVSVFSFSKIYAMTGWRVGYAAAPADFADRLRVLQEPQVSCPSTISQKAAEAALSGPRGPIEKMIDAYRRRRALALDVASAEGLTVVPPAGALYMMVSISEAPGSSLDFALHLLETQGVSVAPGSVFGPAGEGWVRISLAADDELLAEGLRRLAKTLRAQTVVAT
jgi:aspartate/methionine/tyrosine aminotransferase